MMYDRPIKKTAKEMQYGDIYRCEYGDFDNWVNVVFESCNSHGTSTEIHFHHINSKTSDTMYDLDPIDKVVFDVVGRED